jgi:hypothetical protein
MEVYAHTHTERKRFKHYLWEFLMLFLAVFAGFLAENQREHYVEKQRAKEYAYQMIEDLKHDTLDLARFVKIIQAHHQSFDTANVLFDQVPPVSNKILLEAILPQRSNYPIQLSATTFNQMKSSGNIRYFRKKELAKAVSDYYDRAHSFLNVALNYANDFFNAEIQPFMLNHFDYSQSDYFTDTLKVENPIYLDRSPQTDILLRNRLILYNSILKWNVDIPVKFVQEKATKLIEMLKNEYHIK